MELVIDKSQGKIMDISVDAFNLLVFDKEPVYDSTAKQTVAALLRQYPLGLDVTNYRFYPGENRVTVLISPYVEKEIEADFNFRYDGFMYLTDNIVLEIMFSTDRTMAYTRWHKQGEVPFNYKNLKLERTPNGVYYIKPQPNWVIFITPDSFIKR